MNGTESSFVINSIMRNDDSAMGSVLNTASGLMNSLGFGSSPTASAAREEDTASGVDAGLRFDGGVDAGVRVDGGVRPDAGVVVDAGIRPDAGVVVDAGIRPDAGVVVDAGIRRAVVECLDCRPVVAGTQ